MQSSLNYEDPQLVEQMMQLSIAAMSPNVAEREEAERQIKVFQDSVDQQSGFLALLLQVVQQRPQAAVFCSVLLKNTVKQCWNPAMAEHCASDYDKQLLRSVIIGVMLKSHGAVQRNLAETIAIMADVDFPTAWPDALNVIIETLQANAEVSVQCAALSTAHSILCKYREVADFTESFVSEMTAIYTMLFPPLLGCMERMLLVCETTQTPATTEACNGLISAVECLIDITSLDLSDEFIYKLQKIVELLMRCLQLQNPYLVNTAHHGGGPLVVLKSECTSCVSRFLSNYDEDFEKYAGDFLQVVWNVVADPANSAPSMDDLVIRGLEMLTNACAGTTRSAFDNAELLHNLVGKVVIPNLALQEEDIILYETEPDAYIQRDIEGSDLHTRRRAAGELVRMLVKMVPDKARPLLSAEASNLLTGSSATCSPVSQDSILTASPTAVSSRGQEAAVWRAKDTGIFLTSSLALEGQHVDAQRGISQAQLSNLIPFDTFFTQTILPEICSEPSASSPLIIKADCIRVVATFRDHISPSYFPQMLQALPRWLASPDPVVATYAANAIDRLLLARRQQIHVVTEAIFAPHAGPILQALCGKLTTEEQPNAYVAQCLLRVQVRMPESAGQYLQEVITTVSKVLLEAAKNPSNPLFSHCLFEVASKCIAQHREFGPAFEQVLWDCLTAILVNDVAEYMPYALQILAQLLDTHPKGTAGPPEIYKAFLPPLTQPDIYRQKGNIPAVVCLLSRFISNYPAYVDGEGLSEKILNIFRMLVQLKMYDHEGLTILTSMMLHYPADVMGRYLTASLQVLLQRMQTSPTPKFIRIFIIFLSIAVCVRGAPDLVARMSQIQHGLFFMVLDKIWLPNMQKVTGKLERKVCIVALARLLTESADLQAQPQAWANSVLKCLRMIHDKEEADDHTSFAPQTVTLNDLAKLQAAGSGAVGGTMGAEQGGFTNVFCPLEESMQKPVDVCENISNPDLYFRQQMKQLLTGPNGAALLSVLQETLNPSLIALIQ